MAALAVLLGVPMAGAFVEAGASTVSMSGGSMVIDLTVEIDVAADAVLAHLSSGDDRLLIPLIERRSGLYGIRTELPVKNWVVVFEILGADAQLSEPVSLGFLGADLGQPTTTLPEPSNGGIEPADEARRWGFLALALTAASLSALAFWVLGGRDPDEDEGAEPEEE